MKTYRNVKTGVTVQIEGEAKGDWVIVPDSLVSEVPEAKPEVKPEKKTSKKTKTK